MMKNEIKTTGKILLIIALCFINNVYFISELKAQNISTVAEIYNFDVGDIFHVDKYGTDGGSGFSTILNIEIVEKFYTGNDDTLFYVRDVAAKTNSSEYPYNVYDYYFDTIYYFGLGSLIFSGNIDSVYSDTALYNGRTINYKFAYDSIGSQMWTYKYAEGCGQAYYEYYSWDGSAYVDYYEKLIYYKKGDEEWGNPYYVSVEENKKADKNRILIYPNPAHDFFEIHTEDMVSQVTVYSLTGQTQMFIDDVHANSIINVSNLSTGVYYVKVKTGDLNRTVKLLKR